MFPDEVWAEATGSFKRPVIPPSVDPDQTPTKTVAISCDWLPYIRGALQQLLLQATWQATTPEVLALTQARVWNLIDMFDECASGGDIPFACFGALDASSAPFGSTWTIACGIGVWTLGLGYLSTKSDSCGNMYSGIDINIDLGVPVHITDIELQFDMIVGGSLDGAHDTVWVGVYDLDNGHWIGPTLDYTTVTTGLSQTLHTGPNAGTTQNLHVVVIAGQGAHGNTAVGGTSVLPLLFIQGSSNPPLC